MNSVARYFSLRPADYDARRLPLGSRSAWAQWVALFLGVAIQPYFEGFREKHVWQFSGFWGWTLFALITSVIIFPAVYRKAFDGEAPAIVQIAPIFAAGLGWESLIGTVVKAIR